MICIAGVFTLGYFGFLKNEWLSSLLIQIIVMCAIPLLLYTLLVSKNFKQTLADVGFKKISGKMLLISIALGLVLYFLNSFIATGTQTFIALFGFETIGSAGTIKVSYNFMLKEFLLTAILPGVCEEILHRGIMLHAKKQYSNPKICLLTSSILFGLIHLNINQFFYAAILGGLMGYVALASNSIWPTIIIHFSNNFLSTYFNYGKYLNFPLAVIAEQIKMLLLSNPIVFISVAIIGTMLLIKAYQNLCKSLIQERTKQDVEKILEEIRKNSESPNEVFDKIEQINYIIEHSNSNILNKKQQHKSGFVENIFLVCSFTLGILITISSFIWGVI